MAVLVIGEVNLSEEVYAGMVSQLAPLLKASPGFVIHAGGPGGSAGWRVIEVWDSEEEAQTWFDTNVVPNLPPGVEPNRTYHPLHTVVKP